MSTRLKMMLHWIAFSLQDLFSRRSAWLTWAIIATIALVCGILMDVMGLVRGAEEVGKLRAEKTPLARRMLVGDIKVMPRKVTPQVLEDLHTGINQRLQAEFPGSKLREISPFRIVHYGWKRVGSHGGMIPAKPGRTLRLDPGQKLADHPLLKDQKDDITIVAPGDATEGVIVCPKLLNLLGLTDVKEFRDRMLTTDLNGDSIDLPVLAILSKDLPENVYFIIPELYNIKLQNREPDVQLRFLLTGSLHPRWEPQSVQFKTLYETYFEPKNFEPLNVLPAEINEFGDPLPSRLKIELKNDVGESQVPFLSDWKAKLKLLHEALAKTFNTTGDTDHFEDYNAQDQIPKPAPLQDASAVSNDYVELYFEKVAHIPPGLEVAKNFETFRNYPTCVNSAAADQLLKAQQENQALMDLVGYLEWILYALLTCSLGIVQVLRSALKVTEAGMLKAIGVGRMGLIKVVVIQAGIIWSLGAVIGMVAGYWLGPSLSQGFYSDPLERNAGFLSLAIDGWSIFGFSGVISVVVTLGATSNWHFRSAASLLNNR